MDKRIIFLFVALTMTTFLSAQNDTDTTNVSIGYSNTSELTSAGAVDQVTQERMNKGLLTNSLDALSGQAAGVQVQTNGNHEAMLSAVRVRGTTSLMGGFKRKTHYRQNGKTAEI